MRDNKSKPNSADNIQNLPFPFTFVSFLLLTLGYIRIFIPFMSIQHSLTSFFLLKRPNTGLEKGLLGSCSLRNECESD